MGAESFITLATGKTAEHAFSSAHDAACYEHGHGGYTGTIAEKSKFVMIEIKPDDIKSPRRFVAHLIDEGDDRIDDKWGPAGCISLGNNEYLFFGWASS